VPKWLEVGAEGMEVQVGSGASYQEVGSLLGWPRRIPRG